jgi:hypothetical protein
MAIKNPDICNNLNNELTHHKKSSTQYKYLGIIIENYGRIPIKIKPLYEYQII